MSVSTYASNIKRGASFINHKILQSKLVKKSSKKAGLPPGSLIHVGERKIDKTLIRIVDYNETNVNEKTIKDIEECLPCRDEATVTWINIDGLHDINIIEKMGTYFDIHPLILEDILHTGQRPKMEDHESYIYIVLKMLYYDEDKDDITEEQFSLILGSTFVISFQEQLVDVFNPLRERIRTKQYRINKKKNRITWRIL